MRSFTDASGREWAVAINGATVKRCAKLLDIDIGNPARAQGGGPPLAQRIYEDVGFLVDFLYVVCKPQADAADLSDEKFAGLLAGDVLRSALAALEKEWADFFRQFGRESAALLIEKTAELVARAMQIRMEKLADPKLMEEAEAAIRLELGTVS